MIQELMIAAFTPSFLQKEVLWFEENEDKIRKISKSNAFWKKNVLFIEEGRKIGLSEFLRQLDELNYQKVYSSSGGISGTEKTLPFFGEFMIQGGIVSIFPVNADRPVRIEFLGNKIERIESIGKIAEKTSVGRKEREDALKKIAKQKEAAHLRNLKSGAFVVHLDHGIGIYKGMESMQTADNNPRTQRAEQSSYDGESVNYYVLEYAPPKDGKDPDRLLVPEGQAKKLSIYLGFESPKIHRLSGSIWEHTKKKATEDAQKLAVELLEIYSKREIASRQAYQNSKHLQQEFENLFEHLETEDQKKAIEEVYEDMERDKPMDRLICGDVGFGKTEVAMRAAFKAVLSGKPACQCLSGKYARQHEICRCSEKEAMYGDRLMAGRQVAILCPTTILADQHLYTFTERFEKFPFNIAMLSRFENKKNQQETTVKLKTGKIDIIIGTHRLLSKDIEFKNLGLLIIDEEQRFGVRQKEKLKKLREDVDILSLSATPIPRTLYLAMSGLRQISVINTPPFGRKPIETFVLPYGKEMIRKAIKTELNRSGQVYFLHNRIETIEQTKTMLAGILPSARIETAHGRMGELRLRKIMQMFKAHKIDVLVSTTIIENGLDIKNANTLIVDDAARLGLAQAHQIRGRIGRAEVKSYAYFLYSAKHLSEDAEKRLEALKEASELGSGYLIAQRDLEIRGAGNILGREQSGAINQVGLNLYC